MPKQSIHTSDETHAHVDGHELFYTVHGDGPPLLLMHGGPGLDHTYFRPWLDPLGEHVQLIYYDQLGSGRSERPAHYDGIGFDTWTAEADALRAHLGHERIVVLGHSFGGYVAQEYALRCGEHLAGLILCSTAPALDYPDVIMANAQSRSTPRQFETVVENFSNLAAAADTEHFRTVWTTILPLYFETYDPEVGARMDESTRYNGAVFSHAMTKCLPTFNTLPRLGEISVPTLVLAGRHDWICPPAQGAERLHAELPNAELVVFEESGHFPFIEERTRFLSAVIEWLESIR